MSNFRKLMFIPEIEKKSQAEIKNHQEKQLPELME